MRETNKSDHQLLISTAADWRQTPSTAQRKQVEGVILGGNAQADLVSEFQSQHIAVVLVNNQMTGFDLPCILSDEFGGVRQVVEHLVQRGHRHIGMIAGRFSPYIVGARYNAFLSVTQEYEIQTDAQDIRMCDADVDDAARAAMELLDRPDRPTAVFGANDVVAAGILKAARRLGLRVPEDLAVVGFDDSSVCGMLEPELTSVRINCRKMGELCVERLRALLAGEDCPLVTTVPTQLHIRGTT